MEVWCGVVWCGVSLLGQHVLPQANGVKLRLLGLTHKP
jgi:hypothetical protein